MRAASKAAYVAGCLYGVPSEGKLSRPEATDYGARSPRRERHLRNGPNVRRSLRFPACTSEGLDYAGGRTEDEGELRTASVEPCSPGISVPHLATLGRFRSGRSNIRNGVSVGPEELPVALTAVRWTSAAGDPGAQSPDHPDHDDDQDQGPHAAAEGRVHVFLRPRPKKGRNSYRAQEGRQDQSATVHDPPFPKNDRRPKFFPSSSCQLGAASNGEGLQA